MPSDPTPDDLAHRIRMRLGVSANGRSSSATMM
jgi:hypothetical protein